MDVAPSRLACLTTGASGVSTDASGSVLFSVDVMAQDEPIWGVEWCPPPGSWLIQYQCQQNTKLFALNVSCEYARVRSGTSVWNGDSKCGLVRK